jgi:hypothetical protein
MGSDKATDKTKKPLCKRWWFWVIIFCNPISLAIIIGVISGIIGAATGTLVTTKKVVEQQIIDCERTTKEDTSLLLGETKVSQECVNGIKEITYEVQIKGGEEISRKQIGEKVVKTPVSEITLVGTKVESPAAEQTYVPSSSNTNNSSGDNSNGGASSKDSPGGDGYYNSNGDYVPSPGSSASGASGICNNGEYTYAKNKRGACSKQGGVKQWF